MSPSNRPFTFAKLFRGKKSEDQADTHIDKPTTEMDYLIKTADSIVTFVLEGLQKVGGHLPGIGAVAIVLSAKDKFMVSSLKPLLYQKIF